MEKKNPLEHKRKTTKGLKIILFAILTLALFVITLILLLTFLPSYSFLFFPSAIIMFDIVEIVEKWILKESLQFVPKKKLLLSWVSIISLSFILIALAKLLEIAFFPIEKISTLFESLTLLSNSVLLIIENRRAIDQKSIRSWAISSAVYGSLSVPFLIVSVLNFFSFKSISPKIVNFSSELAFVGFFLLILIDRRKYFLFIDED